MKVEHALDESYQAALSGIAQRREAFQSNQSGAAHMCALLQVQASAALRSAHYHRASQTHWVAACSASPTHLIGMCAYCGLHGTRVTVSLCELLSYCRSADVLGPTPRCRHPAVREAT